jgi:hypothetical protein
LERRHPDGDPPGGKDDLMSGTLQHLQTPRPGDRPGWSLAASVSSVLSAFLASACCIGPLVFALLGIGGGGLLVKLEPYRLYFIVVTFALLGAGFSLTYRKPPASRLSVGDRPACDCSAARANRAGKIMLWCATALTMAFLAAPYLTPVFLR